MPRTRDRSSASAVVDDSRASPIKRGSGGRVPDDQFLGQAEVHRQRHQLGLGTVMQVPFDPPEFGGRMIDAVRPGGLQFADALLQLGVLRAGEQPGGRGVGAQQQRRAPPAERQEREGDQRGQLEREPDGLHFQQPREVPPARPVAEPETQPGEQTAADPGGVGLDDHGAEHPTGEPAVHQGEPAQDREKGQQQRQSDPDHQQCGGHDQERQQHEPGDPQQQQGQDDPEQRPAAGRLRRWKSGGVRHGFILVVNRTRVE